MAKITILTPKTQTTLGYIDFSNALKAERQTPKTTTNIQYYEMDNMGDAILEQEQTLMDGEFINGSTILALFQTADAKLVSLDERVTELETRMTAVEAVAQNALSTANAALACCTQLRSQLGITTGE